MEYIASLHSSKGLCIMAILRYALLRGAFLRYSSLRCVSLRYALLRNDYLHHSSLRYVCFRDGYLQNRLGAIQIWIEAFRI